MFYLVHHHIVVDIVIHLYDWLLLLVASIVRSRLAGIVVWCILIGDSIQYVDAVR
jgi:hypothetical protein